MAYRISYETPNFCQVNFTDPSPKDFQELHDAGWRIEGALLVHGPDKTAGVFYRPVRTTRRPPRPYPNTETQPNR